MLSLTTVHGLSAEDINVAEVFSPGTPTVTLRLGEISVFITDTAVLDALHEATTRAYELLAETVIAS